VLGTFYDGGANWSKTRSGNPDGSFALFRSDADWGEVISDPAASRTIWYYQDDEQFIAATSQRAIVLFLGSFEFDPRVIPWVFSTGTLGPLHSWDARIHRLAPGASIALDRRHWTLSLEQRPVRFSVQQRSRDEFKQELRTAVAQTIKSFGETSLEDWSLPLSGGYDSRAILCFLGQGEAARHKLRTITWGLEESLSDHGNDAYVAQALAKACGVSHKYLHTDLSNEPVGDIIDRFILCGEGRVDHVAGYMDGMKIWRGLAEDEGVHGVIRGDEGFGWCAVSSELTVRLSTGCATCADFTNLSTIVEDFGLEKQALPPDLARRPAESLDAWRDRLYHLFRIPTVLAALADVKLSYVEQVTPLLSRVILDVVRQMPDELRLDKRLFREIVDDVSPPIPYARRGANADKRDLLKGPAVVEFVGSGLRRHTAVRIFGSQLVERLLDGLRTAMPRQRSRLARMKAAAKALVPRGIKNRLWDSVAAPKVDGNVLAFRAYIIAKMHDVLSGDASSTRSGDAV
jgi:hypothetical protein